jgi:hypothetical protein
MAGPFSFRFARVLTLLLAGLGLAIGAPLLTPVTVASPCVHVPAKVIASLRIVPAGSGNHLSSIPGSIKRNTLKPLRVNRRGQEKTMKKI